MSRRANVIKVWLIEEWGYLVRGTTDETRARAEVYHYLRTVDDYDAADATRSVLAWAAVPERLWRMNPCTCGDEHRFDLDHVRDPNSKAARGAFPGVLLAAW